MATRVLGIDLGSYSVKVLVAAQGFRHATALELVERPVPPGDEPEMERAARVVGDIVRERGLEHDTPYAALSGDHVHTRILEFGFRNLRRADLAKVVGGELEGTLPIDLDEMVFDFDSLPRDLNKAAAAAVPGPDAVTERDLLDEDPTVVRGPAGAAAPPRGAVAVPAEGMRVLACAANVALVREFLQLLGKQGAEPRGVIAAPAAYRRVLEAMGASGDGSPVAMIDLGHARTNVCVIAGNRVVFARTVRRGGRDVSQAIASAWRMPLSEAEQAKHTDGFIGSTLEPPPSDAWRRIHEVVANEMEPLARDLRQTFRACRAETGVAPLRVVLVGGGARLRGIASFLGEQLGTPVSLIGPVEAQQLLGADLAQTTPADTGMLALGVALDGATGRPQFDLRQGELGFKADLSFLRGKLVHLSAAALIIVAFIAGSAYASLYRLRQAETTLEERLVLETTQVFGEARSAGDVLALASPEDAKGESPLPRMTAYDLLLDINNRLPGKQDATIDLKDVEIRPGKISITGSAAANAEIDAIERKLKTQECFEDVSVGSRSASAEGSMNFSLTIKSNCM